MALTDRFGLTTFGAANGADGSVEGSLADDGGKYTGSDRRVIDRVLAAFEVHNHVGGERLGDPDTEPGIELFTEGGELPSGTTLYYRVAYIDRFGLETAAGPEVSVDLPGSVAPPDAPRVQAEEGGELDEGLFWYALTGHSDGNETQLSAPSAITLTDWRKVDVSAPYGLPVGTDEVSVWRQGPFDSGFTRLVTVPVPDPTDEAALTPIFTDDGSIPSDPCACDPENMPPDENLTNATNAVRITIPVEDVLPGTLVRRWRVYRTETSGEYSAASLVSEVSETVEEDGGRLVNEFVDYGVGDPGPGAPRLRSQTLTPSRALGSGGSGGSGGQFFVSSPNGTIWRLVAGVSSGQLETRDTGLSTDVDMAYALHDEESGLWRLTADDGGALVTESISEQELGGLTEFRHGQGPDIPTSDATVTWRLEVSTDGQLETTGVPIPGSELIYMQPVSDEPDAPEVGGVLYLHGGGLRFKDSSGVITTLA